jgi:hypothetical protein
MVCKLSLEKEAVNRQLMDLRRGALQRSTGEGSADRQAQGEVRGGQTAARQKGTGMGRQAVSHSAGPRRAEVQAQKSIN